MDDRRSVHSESDVVLSLFFMGAVSADVEPNDQVFQTEQIYVGRHNGTVGPMDYTDWYRVEDIGKKEVKVTGTIFGSPEGKYIQITSCDAYGIPDDQIDIHLGGDTKSDFCHWKDPGDSGIMRIQVVGTGEYILKIEFEGESGPHGFPLGWLCLILPILIGVIIILIGGIALASSSTIRGMISSAFNDLKKVIIPSKYAELTPEDSPEWNSDEL